MGEKGRARKKRASSVDRDGRGGAAQRRVISFKLGTSRGRHVDLREKVGAGDLLNLYLTFQVLTLRPS